MLTSIITVCYNSEKTIGRTIESVLKQTADNIEYLIVDGGSQDRTLEICESYRERLEKRGFRFLVRSEPDKGIYDAMNKGISWASGDLIGIINSDDWYEPHAVKTMVRVFEREGCDLAFADIRMHMTGGKTFVKRAKVRPFTTSRDWNHPTQFVKREVYDCFRYRCRNISDDMDLYFRVKRAGYKIVAIHKVLANFQMGGVSNRIPLREVPERILRRYRIYRENGYSRLYLLECIAFELVKYLLV
ncbi:MAG: glycosyltransferase [Lachnospiraceae bacterium]|nr:glycosyltransferase [Lachnospiraceae bacterium]